MSTKRQQSRNHNASPFTILGRNTTDRIKGELAVHGSVPAGLNGVLYRNGPGMFSRGSRSKGTLLDGDGVVQRLELSEGKAHYSRRFVRTEKFIAEDDADRFIAPTWTTKADGVLSNVGGRVLSQAGVTITMINDSLYALDEVAPGYRIDPLTLDTLGEATLGLPHNDYAVKAHTRYLPASNAWVLASTRMGPKGMSIDFVRHYPDGRRVRTPGVASPRMSYLHDFGVTQRHAVVILQPAFVRPLRFLSGQSTFRDSLHWRPDEGNIVLLIDLDTGATRRFEAPAAWVWHIGNAYETADAVIVDFVGYDDPAHFLGDNAQLAALMQGRQGVNGASGQLRRYIMDTITGQLKETVIKDGNHEFPMIDPRCSATAHRCIYSTCGNAQDGVLHSQIAATDTDGGKMDVFDFGAHVNVLEPVFARDSRDEKDNGWLITQFLDTERGTSGFAILDAQNVKAGPVATLDLGETIPISFHGQWVPR